jgi:hypothetical protein
LRRCYFAAGTAIVLRRDFGTEGCAAGASSIGKLKRRIPSKECSAAATAPVVATHPISPTPFDP